MNLLEILKKNADNAKSYIDGLVSKKQDTLTFDTTPTEGSQNPVTSDGIQKAIAAKTVDFSNYPTKNGTGATGTWPISISGTATKASQDSNGKVITDTYLKKMGDTATGDITAPNFIGHLKGNADTATKATQDADGNAIADTYATKTELSGKQDKLIFDTNPTANSTNPVTSDGIKKAIDAKTVDLSGYQTKLTFDSTPTVNSTNPVTSGGVKTYVDNALASLIDGDTKSY